MGVVAVFPKLKTFCRGDIYSLQQILRKVMKLLLYKVILMYLAVFIIVILFHPCLIKKKSGIITIVDDFVNYYKVLIITDAPSYTRQ